MSESQNTHDRLNTTEMFSVIGKFFTDLLTGTNNTNFEVARVSLFIAVLTMSGAQVYALIKGQAFDPAALGVGFASVIGGAGLGIAVKDRAKNASGDGQ